MMAGLIATKLVAALLNTKAVGNAVRKADSYSIMKFDDLIGSDINKMTSDLAQVLEMFLTALFESVNSDMKKRE